MLHCSETLKAILPDNGGRIVPAKLPTSVPNFGLV
jgi:hypothetical protein